MKKFTIMGFVQAKPADAWEDRNVYEGFQLQILGSEKMECFGYTCLGPVNVEVDIDFNPRAKYIEVLQAKEKELEETFHKSVQAIRKQISELSALEHTA